MLRAEPLIGRTFAAGEDAGGRDRVVVLSHRLWVTRFGADRGILGRTILLNNVPHEVIGIMPESFPARTATPDYGISTRDPLYWIPLAFDETQKAFRKYGDFRVIGAGSLRWACSPCWPG